MKVTRFTGMTAMVTLGMFTGKVFDCSGYNEQLLMLRKKLEAVYE